MLFNTLSFAIFLPVVFVLHWFVAKNNTKHQNIILLLASYYFYASWDWRFLSLLLFSTFLDYFTGIQMDQSKTVAVRRFWFWLSVCINLGVLGVFKYFNFFTSSFAELISSLGFVTNPWTLKLILPIGISFYTFHGLSYVIDIYNKKIRAEKNFIDYSLFVSFFPLLVAGPIERATHLLPQIQSKRIFDYAKAVDGLKQILWGLFKKVVIADQCAIIADQIFNNQEAYSSVSLVIGAIFFAMQIYGDFSGYSDIAIGVAKLFGIDLLRNFSYPYFSRSIAEFWRRWHISLSTWFRDYLYIPMGGSKGTKWQSIRNTFIIFLVSGFWHGANWTFIVWGFLHALYIMPSIILKTNRNYVQTVSPDRAFPSLKELINMLATFGIVTFAWIFFRSENISSALGYISGLFRYPESFLLINSYMPYFSTILWVVFFIMVEWVGRMHAYPIAVIGFSSTRAIRWGFYYALIVAILAFSGTNQQFIYFQF